MATRNIFSLLASRAVEGSVMAARPALADDGINILTWRTNGQFCGAYALVELVGTLDAEITAAGGDGVELWAYTADGTWELLAELRDGRTIKIGDGYGYAQRIDIIGVFERLAVVGTVSAGVATVRLTPIEAWS